MSSYAVERNLPIFKKNDVVRQEDRFYIKGKISSDSFLGVMCSTPRKEYFAYIESHNGKSGRYKIGRLEYSKVNKLKLNDGDNILIEVVPNEDKGIIFRSEYIPSYSSCNLNFTDKKIKLSFLEWLNFI